MVGKLAEALRSQNSCIAVEKELLKGKTLAEIAKDNKIKPIPDDFRINIDKDWWLRQLCSKAKLSVFKVSVLLYFILLIPSLIVLPSILQEGMTAIWMFLAGHLATIILIFSLLLLDFVFNGLKKLINQLNNEISKFVTPFDLISQQHIESSRQIEKYDKEYRNLYLKSMFLKTTQLGTDLAYNKRYQLGAGLIAGLLFTIIFSLRYIFNIISPTLITYWTPSAQIETFWLTYSFFHNLVFVLFVGMLIWSLFVVFLINLQASTLTIKIKSHEQIKELYQPFISVMLRTSFSAALIFAWFSPYVLFFTLSNTVAERQSAVSFVESTVAIMIPILILSIFLPIIQMHKGMNSSRDRALLIKTKAIEKLQKQPLPNLSDHLRLENHLIEDYRRISDNSEWALNSTQAIEVFGTILFPILTFFISNFF